MRNFSLITKVRRRPISNWFSRSMNLEPGATRGIVRELLVRNVEDGNTEPPGVHPVTVQSVGYFEVRLRVQFTYFNGSGASCHAMLSSNFHHNGMFPITLNSCRNGIKPDSLQNRRLLGSLMAPLVRLLPSKAVLADASQAMSVTRSTVQPPKNCPPRGNRAITPSS